MAKSKKTSALIDTRVIYCSEETGDLAVHENGGRSELRRVAQNHVEVLIGFVMNS
jgi:hypothetical protein